MTLFKDRAKKTELTLNKLVCMLEGGMDAFDPKVYETLYAVEHQMSLTMAAFIKERHNALRN